MQIDSSSKTQSAFFDVTLWNLIAEGRGQYQFLGKITTHFPCFNLSTPLSQM